NRATEETILVDKKIGEKIIYQRHGLKLAPSFPFPKILWLKRNRPDVYSKVRWFHQAKDFVVSKLTDIHVTDVTHATGYFCLDVRTQKVDYSSLELFDIDADTVPEIKPCNVAIGETGSPAKEYGLPVGVPIVNGAIDAIMALLGMGVFHDNIVCEVAGTSTVLVNTTSKAIMDPTQRFLVNMHPLGNMWLSSSVINTTGAVLRWFRDKIWRLATKNNTSIANPYELFDKWAAQSPPGSKGLIMLPYLQGERSPLWDPQAKGVFFGITLQHNLYDFVRAIYESSALVNIHNIHELSSLGLEPKEVRISGGPAQSDIWNQIKADAYGLPVLRPNVRFPENKGDAILAGLATKQLSLRKAKTWINIDKQYIPDPGNHATYDKLLGIFIKLYNDTKELMQSIKAPPARAET
ncbi:MAG: xylulokinase, partial [Candidatus Ranarchaeia archaeon]